MCGVHRLPPSNGYILSRESEQGCPDLELSVNRFLLEAREILKCIKLRGRKNFGARGRHHCSEKSIVPQCAKVRCRKLRRKGGVLSFGLAIVR